MGLGLRLVGVSGSLWTEPGESGSYVKWGGVLDKGKKWGELLKCIYSNYQFCRQFTWRSRRWSGGWSGLSSWIVLHFNLMTMWTIQIENDLRISSSFLQSVVFYKTTWSISIYPSTECWKAQGKPQKKRDIPRIWRFYWPQLLKRNSINTQQYFQWLIWETWFIFIE